MQEGLAEKIERKTRKQFPNGIESYGSDALRMTFYSLATHTKDISFELGRLKGYRNFCNKIWNAARFINNYPMESDVFEAKNDSDKWIEEEFNAVEKQINKNIAEYRLDFAMNEIYEFFWGKFCDRYIEECKASGETANLHPMLKKILKLMHPFAPFITEEINELIEAVENNSNKIHEAADVFYHLIMYLEANDVKIEDVMEELNQRKK